MDILKFFAECIWDFLAGMYPEVVSLLLRWTLMMILLCCSGEIAKQYYRQGLKDTLIIQILGTLISISVSIAVPFNFLHEISDNLRCVIILCSIFAWFLLPYLVPKLIIRSFGYQIITRKIIYITEIAILSIQIITCIIMRLTNV